jgi:hypothetical protein
MSRAHARLLMACTAGGSEMEALHPVVVTFYQEILYQIINKHDKTIQKTLAEAKRTSPSGTTEQPADTLV